MSAIYLSRVILIGDLRLISACSAYYTGFGAGHVIAGGPMEPVDGVIPLEGLQPPFSGITCVTPWKRAGSLVYLPSLMLIMIPWSSIYLLDSDSGVG